MPREVCVVCRAQGNLHPYTMGWLEVSIHPSCKEEHLKVLDDVFCTFRKVQLRLPDTRPFGPTAVIYRCRGCKRRFRGPPGPVDKCPYANCPSLYFDWENYRDRIYFLFPKRKLKHLTCCFLS